MQSKVTERDIQRILALEEHAQVHPGHPHSAATERRHFLRLFPELVHLVEERRARDPVIDLDLVTYFFAHGIQLVQTFVLRAEHDAPIVVAIVITVGAGEETRSALVVIFIGIVIRRVSVAIITITVVAVAHVGVAIFLFLFGVFFFLLLRIAASAREEAARLRIVDASRERVSE